MISRLLLLLPAVLLFQACDNTSTMYRHGDVAPRDGTQTADKVSYKKLTYQESWVKNLPYQEANHPSASVEDSAGNFYLTGGEFTNNIGDIFIAKYDSNASLLWSKSYDFGQSEEATAITIDQNGSIYVAGYNALTHTGRDRNITVLKVDSEGNTLWHTTYGSDTEDEAAGIALDSQNNVYVIGTTKGDLDNATAIHWRDGFLTKHSPEGQQLWTRIFGTTYSDYAKFIHIDKQDNIFIGGSTSGVGDIYFTKYNTKGESQWMRTYPTNNFDYDLHMSLGHDGYFYMTGKTGLRDKNNEYIKPNTDEIFARKVDFSGDEVWYHTYGTPAQNELAHAITSDKYGNILLLGSSKGNFDNDTLSEISHPILLQLNPHGEAFSSKVYEGNIFNHADIHLTQNGAMMVIGGGNVKLNESNTYGSSNVTFFLKAIPTE